MDNKELKAEIIRRLKPLEWNAGKDGKEFTAEIGMLGYSVFQYLNSDNWTSVCVVNGKQPADMDYRSFATPDLAKAACETDRITRVFQMLGLED